jgi:outer membrane protein, multidrug efflux system
MRELAALLTTAVAAVAAVACSPHTVQKNPLPPVELPDHWATPTAAAAALPDRWWQSFGDAQLDRLVTGALDGNLQLKAAFARVRQARAIVEQAASARLPQLDLTAQASRTRQRFQISDTMVFTPTIDLYQVSVAAGYELDVWGRVASSRSAAVLDALAMRDDAEAIAISLAAEVSEAWFDVVATRAQQAILRAQQQINETYLELTLLRFRQAGATAIDVFQQRQQVLSTRALIEQADGVLRVSTARLAVLLGKPPLDRSWIEAAPDVLPEPAPPPALGVPADLLTRRPDVRAARRRAEAADYRIAVAIADRLPALRIGGNVGSMVNSPLDLLDGFVFGVFGQLAQAVFDGGRRKAEVERSRDVVDERLAQLGHQLIAAMAEVDQALADETTRRVELATLDERRELAAKTLTEAREFYAQGLIDYLSVLTSLASLQSLELQQLQARRALLSARIRLYRALGGTWTQELGVPERAKTNPQVRR